MPRLAFSIPVSIVALILVGCQPSKKMKTPKTDPTPDSVSILSRDKLPGNDKKDEIQPSIRDEFVANIRKKGGANNEISRDDCEAITAKTTFRYSSVDDNDILIYPITKELVPINHLKSGKCTLLKSITLQKEATDFVYAADGKPLIKTETLWALERIEGCDKDFEYIPDCKTLAKYTKEIFVDDQSKSSGDVKRQEFSVHHRQPLDSWLLGECKVVQGDDHFNCRKEYAQFQIGKYREYIVSNNGESFKVYLSNKEVLLD